MKYIFFIVGILLFCFISCSSPTNTKQVTVKQDSIVYDLVKNHQLLLTNSANFKEHTSLSGASAFLIKYENKTYAITAKHLIGEAGGVEPELKPNQISDHLLSWKLFPRVPVIPEKDTVVIGKQKMNYDSLKQDILILPVENNSSNIHVLKTNFEMPKPGDHLFIIGCPYSEQNCKQNIYEVTFDSYDPALAMLILKSKIKVVIAGFSGAPLLNSNGDVIGVIIAAAEENGIDYIVATHLKEIENIK